MFLQEHSLKLRVVIMSTWHSWRRNRGFSLLELLAAITIIGIIAAIIIPRLGSSTDRAKLNCSNQYRGDLNSALERYYFTNGAFPPDLDTLYTDGYYPEPIPVDPLTNAPFALDTTLGRLK